MKARKVKAYEGDSFKLSFYTDGDLRVALSHVFFEEPVVTYLTREGAKKFRAALDAYLGEK